MDVVLTFVLVISSFIGLETVFRGFDYYNFSIKLIYLLCMISIILMKLNLTE